jgi:hypothetical protein
MRFSFENTSLKFQMRFEIFITKYALRQHMSANLRGFRMKGAKYL